MPTRFCNGLHWLTQRSQTLQDLFDHMCNMYYVYMSLSNIMSWLKEPLITYTKIPSLDISSIHFGLKPGWIVSVWKSGEGRIRIRKYLIRKRILSALSMPSLHRNWIIVRVCPMEFPLVELRNFRDCRIPRLDNCVHEEDWSHYSCFKKVALCW